MEKNTRNLTLRRRRNLQAILGDGYRLYLKNFLKLVRSSWLQAIVYALVTGYSMACFFTDLLPLMLKHRNLNPELLTWIGTVVVFIVVATLFAFAGGVAPLYEHSQTDNIRAPRHWWGRWPWRLTLRGIVRLPKMLWKALRSGQAGLLVATAFIMLLVVLVATLLLQLPAILLAMANIEAAVGMAHGDAVNLPDNLFLMNFVTFALCGLLQAYIHLSTLFPLYYIWGNCCPEKPNTDTTEKPKD